MTRRLTCGFEDRTDHPQFVGWAHGEGGSCNPHYHYQPGGVEGIGYLELDCDNWSIYPHWVWIRLDYEIVADDEIFLRLHMRPNSSTWQTVESHCRVYWDNSASSDPGYFDISWYGNYIAWSWSGVSQSFPVSINMGQWYEACVRVKVVPGGNEIVQVWFDGDLYFDYEGDLGVAFSEIDRVSVYGYVRETGYNPRPADGFDNLIVNDASGAVDVTVPWGRYLIGLPVNGPGVHTELVPRPGPPNWGCVDDIPPNDSDWVEEYEGGKKDSYAFQNVPLVVAGQEGWEVQRVILRGRHAMTGGEEFPVGFNPLIRNGGDQLGAFKESGVDPKSFEEIWITNPATGNPWEKSEVDALEAGAEVV